MRNKIFTTIACMLFWIGMANAQTSKEYTVDELATLETDIAAGAYDIYILSSSAGVYDMAALNTISTPLTLKAKDGLAAKPIISRSGNTSTSAGIFTISATSRITVTFDGIDFNGVTAGGTSVFGLKASSDVELIVRNCHLHNFTLDNGIFRLDAAGSSVNMTNCLVTNSKQRVINAYTPDAVYGNINISNCTFANINGPVVYFRSASGVNAITSNTTIDHCTFNNIISATDGVLKFRLVNGTVSVTNSIFTANDGEIEGATSLVVDNCYLAGTNPLVAGTNTIVTAPVYADAANSDFAVTNPAELMGNDGKVIGDLSWYASAPLSTNARLSAISLNSSDIASFGADIYTYNVVLPSGTTNVPVVGFTLDDTNASATVTNATTLAGATIINVTAEDGTTQLQYSLTFTVAILSSNARLSDLQIDGVTISAFDKANDYYEVVLSTGTTTVPTLSVTLDGSNATATISDAASIPGISTIAITAEDMQTIMVYTVNFIYPKSTEAHVSDLKVAGASIVGFAPNTLSYDVELPFGTTVAPEFEFTLTDSKALAVVAKPSKLPGAAMLTVTADDNTTQLIYTVNLTIAPSNVATLKELRVNFILVEGFSPTVYTYNVVLANGATRLPTTSYLTTDTKATTSIANSTTYTGSTVVTVTAEDATTKATYTINFSVAPSSVATLSDLKVDNVSIANFNANTLVYNVNLPAGTTAVPSLTYTLTNERATAVISNSTSLTGTSTIVVTAEDNTTKKTYSLQFTVLSSINSEELSGIKVYPNPVRDNLSITVIDAFVGKSYSIYNLAGEQILQGLASQNDISVDVSSLKTGFYFIRFENSMVKIVKE